MSEASPSCHTAGIYDRLHINIPYAPFYVLIMQFANITIHSSTISTQHAKFQLRVYMNMWLRLIQVTVLCLQLLCLAQFPYIRVFLSSALDHLSLEGEHE